MDESDCDLSDIPESLKDKFEDGLTPSFSDILVPLPDFLQPTMVGNLDKIKEEDSVLE